MRYSIYLCMFLIFGCSTSDQYVRYQNIETPKPENCKLDIFSENLELHKKTQVIGEISISDTGFSLGCDAETVIKKIKARACQEGADAIHLFNVKQPNWSKSTCFQASARFLKYE